MSRRRTICRPFPPHSAPTTAPSITTRERGSIMQDVTAKSAKTTSIQRKPRKSADEQIALHLCYRQIGISAVAAAARYQSGAKNPAQAPVANRLDERDTAVA